MTISSHTFKFDTKNDSNFILCFLYFPSAFSRIKVKLAFLLNKGKDFFTLNYVLDTKRISQEVIIFAIRELHLKGKD